MWWQPARQHSKGKWVSVWSWLISSLFLVNEVFLSLSLSVKCLYPTDNRLYGFLRLTLKKNRSRDCPREWCLSSGLWFGHCSCLWLTSAHQIIVQSMTAFHRMVSLCSVHTVRRTVVDLNYLKFISFDSLNHKLDHCSDKSMDLLCVLFVWRVIKIVHLLKYCAPWHLSDRFSYYLTYFWK